MAKLKSLIKIEGTLDGLTFYKSKDGYVVRTKGGVDKDKIANDPAFARTRENGAEFGHSATSGKIFRRSILELLNSAKDSRVTSRLTKVMSQIKNEDLTSVRGKRRVAVGLTTPQGKARLKGFNFNVDAPLETVLLKEYTLNTTTGEININQLVPLKELAIPQGATHVTFIGAFLNLDFETGEKDLQVSPPVNVPLNLTAVDVSLTPAIVPVGTGNNVFFLTAVFFQEMNAIQYPLNNGAYNALSVVEIL